MGVIANHRHYFFYFAVFAENDAGFLGIKIHRPPLLPAHSHHLIKRIHFLQMGH